MKLLSSTLCFVCLGLMAVSCDKTNTPVATQTSTPTVEFAPKASYNYGPITTTAQLITAVHLFNDAGKNMAMAVLQKCKVRERYSAVIYLKNETAYCTEVNSDPNTIMSWEETPETQISLDPNSALAKMAKVIPISKMAVLKSTKISNKIGVGIEDNPGYKTAPKS
jgi:hypothetical protein